MTCTHRVDYHCTRCCPSRESEPPLTAEEQEAIDKSNKRWALGFLGAFVALLLGAAYAEKVQRDSWRGAKIDARTWKRAES